LTYSSSLKIQGISSSETSISCHRITRRYIPEDRILRRHGCEYLKSNNTAFVGRKKGNEEKEKEKTERKNCIGLPQYAGSPAYSCIRFFYVFLFICRRAFIDLYFHQIFLWFFAEKFYI
jgi:hypothetical protein